MRLFLLLCKHICPRRGTCGGSQPVYWRMSTSALGSIPTLGKRSCLPGSAWGGGVLPYVPFLPGLLGFQRNALPFSRCAVVSSILNGNPMYLLMRTPHAFQCGEIFEKGSGTSFTRFPYLGQATHRQGCPSRGMREHVRSPLPCVVSTEP